MTDAGRTAAQQARQQERPEEEKSTPEAYDSRIDLALIKRAQQGDKNAFGLLVSKYQYRLANALYANFKLNQEDTLDMVQESFVRAWQSLGSFQGNSAFYSWLYRIAINTSINYLKKQKPFQQKVDIETSIVNGDKQTESPSVLIERQTPESHLQQQQTHIQIQKLMDDLPQHLKIVLDLRLKQDLDYQQIASQLNIPVGTVRSRLFRIRSMLAEQADLLGLNRS